MTGVVPRRVGRFTLGEQLPGGGMSEVFLATDGDNRDHGVVVKLLPARLALDPEYRDRFLREQETLADLRFHPHIVPVIGSGEEDGQLYLAMEHVHGCDLEELLARLRREQRRLAPRDAVEVVRQMCEALEHASSVIHRDVKPGNIMIYDGRVRSTDLRAYLLDFGIARPVVGGRNLTRADSAIGSLPYMAPERFVARTPDEIPDRSVDVYGLCCVLFEALTGELAFGQQTIEALVAAHADRDRRPRPGVVDDDLTRFDAVIADGLAVDPADRLPTPRALAARLARVLDGADGEVHTPTLAVARPRSSPPSPPAPPAPPAPAPVTQPSGLPAPVAAVRPGWPEFLARLGAGVVGAAGAGAAAAAAAGPVATVPAAAGGLLLGVAVTYVVRGRSKQDPEASGD